MPSLHGTGRDLESQQTPSHSALCELTTRQEFLYHCPGPRPLRAQHSGFGPRGRGRKIGHMWPFLARLVCSFLPASSSFTKSRQGLALKELTTAAARGTGQDPRIEPGTTGSAATSRTDEPALGGGPCTGEPKAQQTQQSWEQVTEVPESTCF